MGLVAGGFLLRSKDRGFGELGACRLGAEIDGIDGTWMGEIGGTVGTGTAFGAGAGFPPAAEEAGGGVWARSEGGVVLPRRSEIKGTSDTHFLIRRTMVPFCAGSQHFSIRFWDAIKKIAEKGRSARFTEQRDRWRIP